MPRKKLRSNDLPNTEEEREPSPSLVKRIRSNMKKRRVIDEDIEGDDTAPRDTDEAEENLVEETLRELNGEEDGEYDDKKGMPDKYFVLEQEPLRDAIVKSLLTKSNILPQKKKTELEQAISQALTDARFLTNEYCRAIPSDEQWKIGVDENEIKVCEEILKPIREAMKEELPNLPKILKSNIPFDRKKTAVRYFDMFNNVEPYSTDYYKYQFMINQLIEDGKDVTMEDVNKQERVLKDVKKQERQERITLARVLQCEGLAPEDRLRIYRLFAELEVTDKPSAQYTYLEKVINQELASAIKFARVDIQSQNLTELQLLEKRLKENAATDELSILKRKILNLQATEEIKRHLYGMYTRLTLLRTDTSEYGWVLEKLNFALSLPYDRSIVLEEELRLKTAPPSEVDAYLAKVRRRLDEKLFGMEKVKERIIEQLNNRICGATSSSVLALEGVPGTGKTAILEALAYATGRPCQKISLGGSSDSSILKGDRTVWSGAAPSIILQILKKMGYNDGLVLIDEIDKVCDSARGAEVEHALLHILDYAHNKTFEDAYLQEYTHDLSKIWFICSFNNRKKISAPLLDRLDILVLKPYVYREIAIIFEKYILPKIFSALKIPVDTYVICEGAAEGIMNRSDVNCEGKGARTLDKLGYIVASRVNILRRTLGASNESSLKLSYRLRKPLVNAENKIIIDAALIRDVLNGVACDDDGHMAWRSMVV